ncbi:MAG: AAA domain-containing protein, partial [Balneolaceae bacterium]
MKDVQELISRAIDALDAEIETVREKPSSDVLFSGKRMGKGGSSAADYQFESHQPAIRFAEEITARFAEKELLIHPIAYEKKQVTLRFPEDQGAVIEKVEVEWENDFILKRTRQELVRLLDQKKPVLQRLERLFNPNGEAVPFTGSIADDGQRNPPQREAIEKSQTGRTLFVWGPPGTGKTATLGYIIANYLKRNKTVLFASNTNRAVDVGLLSVVHALRETGQPVEATAITRFGDAALEQPELEPLLFDRQIDTIVQQRREKAGEWISLLQQREEV